MKSGIFGLLMAAAAFGQNAAVTFEVATVKPAAPPQMAGGGKFPGPSFPQKSIFNARRLAYPSRLATALGPSRFRADTQVANGGRL